MTHPGQTQLCGYVDVPLEPFDFGMARVVVPAQQVAQHGVVGQRQRKLLRQRPDRCDQGFVERAGFVVVQREAEGDDFNALRAL